MAARKPKSLKIRSYNVGFGDCFLLSFDYEKQQKHVLIDFGSTAPPVKGKKDLELEIAKEIEKVCGGKLHAVVATHRHKDHISGFKTNKKGTASGDIIRKCADAGKALIVQPWTEDPDAKTDAVTARGTKTSRKALVQQLDDMHRFAKVVEKQVKSLDVGDVDAVPDEAQQPDEESGELTLVDRAGTTASKALKNRLGFVGENNVKNIEAIRNLMNMSTKNNHRYVYFGADSGLEAVLPGVKVHVLGPPTIKQHEAVQKERRIDPDEFWMLRQKFWRMQASNARTTLATGNASRLFPDAKVLDSRQQPRTSRWFIRRLRGARAKSLLELVLIMDDAMNNTSVILLFEIGKKKLLFPGDAQIENWEYALSRKKIRAMLAGVDLYKVGHHGSRNATPKTLWNGFRKRGPESKRQRIKTMVSTKSGKFSGTDTHTEVPRRSLILELKAESSYTTTQGSRKIVLDPVEVKF